MTDPRFCGACEGIAPLTPIKIANRPGLDVLNYRIGTHGNFFESLLARLSTLGVEGQSPRRRPASKHLTRDLRHALAGIPSGVLLRDLLTTRQPTDPSIALLDAWATLADVLTFYQERLANEGFLRTAQERSSIEELARLVGYRLRPGVSSTVYLAFEVDGTAPEIRIPLGTAAKSTPTPGSNEEPQTFETSRELLARTEWNEIRPRLTRPQRIDASTVHDLDVLYFQGTGLRLVPSDYLCVVYNSDENPVVKRIVSVEDDQANQRTIAMLQLDDLSSKKVLERIQAAIATFGELKSPPQAEQMRLLINQHLAEVLVDRQKWGSLLTVDIEFHKLVCDRLSPTGDIGVLSDEFSARVTALIGSDTSLTLCLRTLLNLNTVASAFVTNLLSDIDPFRAEDVRLAAIDALLGGTPTIQKILATLEQHLRELIFPNVPVLCWGTDAGIVAATSTPFASFDNVANGISSTSLEAEVTVLRGAPAAFTLTDADFEWDDAARKVVPKAMPTTPPNTDSLLRAIHNLTTDAVERDLLVTVRVAGEQIGVVVRRTGSPKVRLKPEKMFDAVNLSSGLTLNLILDTTEPAPVDSEYAARITIHSLSSSGVIGSIRQLPPASGFSVATAGAGIFTVRPIASGPVTFASFKAVVNTIAYEAPSSPGLVAALVEVFNDQTMLDTDHCIACNTIDLAHCDTNEGRNRVLIRALRNLHKLAATGSTIAAVAAEFWSKLWSAAAQAANKLIHTPPGLVSKLERDSLLNTAVAVKNAVGAVPTNLSQPWRVRLKELREKLQIHVFSATTNVVAVLDAARASLAKSPSPGSVRALAGGDLYLDSFLDELEAILSLLQPQPSPANEFDEVVSFVSSVNGADNELQSDCDKVMERANVLKNELVAIRQVIMSALNGARALFLNDAIESIKESDAVFQATTGIPTPGEQAVVVKLRDWLQSIRGEFESRRSKLENTPALSVDDSCSTSPCYQLECFRARIDKQLHKDAEPAATNPLSITNLVQALSVCTDARRDSLKRIVEKLDALLRRIHPLRFREDAPQQTSGSLETAINALEKLRRATETARQTLVFDLLSLFNTTSDLLAQLSSVLDSTQRAFLYDLLRNSRIGHPVPEPKVFAFRGQANLFGWNASDGTTVAAALLAQLKADVDCIKVEPDAGPHPNYDAAATALGKTLRTSIASLVTTPEDADPQVMFLDGEFRLTGPESVICVRTPGSTKSDEFKPFFVEKAKTGPRTAYGLKGNATELRLTSGWWPGTNPNDPVQFDKAIRNTRILCDAEKLLLAEAPESEDLDPTEQIECDVLLAGLSSNKPVILRALPKISGGQTGTLQSETFLITDVDHSIESDLFNDAFRTTIRLHRMPGYTFKRDSVRIFANVVEATHGETQREVLGSGSGAKEFQQFALRRAELTQLSAPTPTGIQSTLAAWVNDMEWEEQESLRESQRMSEDFVTQTDDSQQTTVVFGDGVNGARVPTGVENVRAVYRTGLGRKGNVAAGQISQLLGGPLGVKKVNNPLAARGGADRESADKARDHAPLAVTAMDRLVSVQDYADFARSYAGIGKASASLLQGAVQVTIAGIDPDPLEADGPLSLNLQRAFELYGDPSQRFELHNREATLLILIARVRIDPKREWEKVQPLIRNALLWKFSYERSELGQDLLLSDAIATIQSVEGVVYVDVNTFDAVREDDFNAGPPPLDSGTVAAANGGLPAPAAPAPSVPPTANGSSSQPRLALQGRDLKLMARIPVSLERLEDGSNTDSSSGATQNSLGASTPATGALRVRAAQLCYLTPDIPDTIILEQIR